MVKNFRILFVIVLLLPVSCQKREERLRTERTAGLVRELLTKLDSTDYFASKPSDGAKVITIHIQNPFGKK